MLRTTRLGAWLATAGAAAALAAPAGAAIWVTLAPGRAPVGAVVRAHADYVGGKALPIFLASESVVEGRSQPDLVSVRGGVEIRPTGAPAFRVGMAPSTMVDEIRADGANLVFVGEMVPDDGQGGTLTFEVPDLRAGMYRTLAHCDSCAPNGGSLLPGEGLVIEATASSSAPWRLIASVAGGALAVAAGGAAWVARRRAARPSAERAR